MITYCRWIAILSRYTMFNVYQVDISTTTLLYHIISIHVISPILYYIPSRCCVRRRQVRIWHGNTVNALSGPRRIPGRRTLSAHAPLLYYTSRTVCHANFFRIFWPAPLPRRRFVTTQWSVDDGRKSIIMIIL